MEPLRFCARSRWIRGKDAKNRMQRIWRGPSLHGVKRCAGMQSMGDFCLAGPRHLFQFSLHLFLSLHGKHLKTRFACRGEDDSRWEVPQTPFVSSLASRWGVAWQPSDQSSSSPGISRTCLRASLSVLLRSRADLPQLERTACACVISGQIVWD